jgi:hypothetical protein
MVALAIGSLVVLGARQMFEQIAIAERRILEDAVATDRLANGERLMRALLLRLEVGTPDAEPFAGNERHLHFTSWCDMPAGWQERCIVDLTIDDAPERKSVMAHIGDGEGVMLRPVFEDAEFRYLESAAGGGRWLHRWSTGVTAPLAVALLIRDGSQTDTTIWRIGGRG